MLRAIVFDLFHTLVAAEDFRPGDFSRVGRIASLLGLDPGELAAHFEATYVERETTPILQVDVVARFAGERGRTLSAAERAEIEDIMGRHDDVALRRPRPEIMQLVTRLAESVPLGLLSNCHEREVRAWPESPLAAHFGATCFSYRIGALKPDAATYATALAGLDVAAADAVFVGNGGSDELDGARRHDFGYVVHCNVFDRMHELVPVEVQAQRAAVADASASTFEELAWALS